MNAIDYRTRFIQRLFESYDAIESEHFFYLLLEDYLGLKRIDLATRRDLEFSAADVSRFNDALEKLIQHVPIQYIIGKAHFYGLELRVAPGVLIPRPETEELVDWIVKDHEFKGRPEILDIGTGSGCIAVSLAKNLTDASVSAIDISEVALEIASGNAALNKVSVRFEKCDILASENLSKKYDVIVSNPPYVRDLEKQEMRENVLEHEPHLALFVRDDDALIFYRKIAQLAAESLSENGTLYFEINQYLSNETCEMLRGYGFKDVELRKDLFGNERMVRARR